MASENNTSDGETAMAGQRNNSSSNGSTNQQQQQQTVDRESGETEAKIPKTSCEENSQNGAPTPQEDGDAESLVASKQQSLQEEDGKEEGGEEESAVPLVVMYNKRRYDVKVALSAKMAKLKEEIQKLTGVPPAMQKLIYKGAPKPDDNKSLVELNLSANAKLMLVGSTLDDVLNLEVPTPEQLKDDTPQAAKEPISKQKLHQKVVDKGVPEDAIPGIRNVKDSLPAAPLSGMLNKSGGKVRLTFKLELDQVWIGTKERTEKINMSSIKQVISEAIEGHEEYHIMALQLGTTEASRYWIYWVPAQYVDAIKETILGK
ncbi:ubiquitin domain-containing protein UBFD1-like isoform X2 [Dermacentor albipictus]|uniref:ubiquitin domain-containing protein UBFD1-like isoform X2 n=1 Tax=Dermacentor albipictus TaxID=60249 RepID=UPI0031FDD54C